jgi:hypothetical protein
MISSANEQVVSKVESGIALQDVPSRQSVPLDLFVIEMRSEEARSSKVYQF